MSDGYSAVRHGFCAQPVLLYRNRTCSVVIIAAPGCGRSVSVTLRSTTAGSSVSYNATVASLPSIAISGFGLPIVISFLPTLVISSPHVSGEPETTSCAIGVGTASTTGENATESPGVMRTADPMPPVRRTTSFVSVVESGSHTSGCGPISRSSGDDQEDRSAIAPRLPGAANT